MEASTWSRNTDYIALVMANKIFKAFIFLIFRLLFVEVKLTVTWQELGDQNCVKLAMEHLNEFNHLVAMLQSQQNVYLERKIKIKIQY